MKYLLALIVTLPTVVSAQQVNYYDTCVRTQEIYVPGYYNQSGSWITGHVKTQRFTVQCNAVGTVTNNYYQSPPPPPPVNQSYQRRRVCNPAAGALLGAGIAGALSGNSWSNGGSWNRSWSRNSSSGSYSNYGRNNYWPLIGAGLGSLTFSC